MASVEVQTVCGGRWDICVSIENELTSSEGEGNRSLCLWSGVTFLHLYNYVFSAVVSCPKALLVWISEKSYQNSIWIWYWRDMQQYCHTLLQMVPVKRCYFVKRSLWQALPGWLFLIIKDEISTTPKTLQNTYTTAMTQNNLYTILGDLKQDVEVDTTGILPLFFPFSILVKSILVWIYFSCITYNLCSVSPHNRCRMIGYMEPSVPFLSLFLSVSLRVN